MLNRTCTGWIDQGLFDVDETGWGGFYQTDVRFSDGLVMKIRTPRMLPELFDNARRRLETEGSCLAKLGFRLIIEAGEAIGVLPK